MWVTFTVIVSGARSRKEDGDAGDNNELYELGCTAPAVLLPEHWRVWLQTGAISEPLLDISSRTPMHCTHEAATT